VFFCLRSTSDGLWAATRQSHYLSRHEIVFCLGFLFHMGIRSVENKACGGKDIKRSGSIVLAATPLLKKEEIKIGSRFFDIPKRKDTHVVNPSMERDIKAVFI